MTAAYPDVGLVAFDLDDTLYPERVFVRSGFRCVSDHLLAIGVLDRAVFDDLEAAFEAGVRGDTFNRALEAAGVRPTDELIAELVEVYRTHRTAAGQVRPDIAPYPDAKPALTRLAESDVRRGIITDGPLVCQQLKVDTLGLAPLVDAVTLTDAWGREFWKPHPRAFREMAERLGVPPAACVYVADNPAKDFRGPAEAGWRPSIRVRRPDSLHRDAAVPPEARVAATIEALDALPDALRDR